MIYNSFAGSNINIQMGDMMNKILKLDSDMFEHPHLQSPYSVGVQLERIKRLWLNKIMNGMNKIAIAIVLLLSNGI